MTDRNKISLDIRLRVILGNYFASEMGGDLADPNLGFYEQIEFNRKVSKKTDKILPIILDDIEDWKENGLKGVRFNPLNP